MQFQTAECTHKQQVKSDRSLMDYVRHLLMSRCLMFLHDTLCCLKNVDTDYN